MISVIRSGIDAAQNELNVASNNIANAKTIGFKKRQATFDDFYGNTDAMSTKDARIGMGAIIAENRIMNQQGTLQQTGDALDIAIEGQGMFTVFDPAQPDQTLYTRDGSFSVDSDGLISNAEGMKLLSVDGAPITIPATATGTIEGVVFEKERPLTGVTITNDGIVQAAYGLDTVFKVGQIGLSTFPDSNRLTPIGQNFFKQNASSGEGVLGKPIADGRGKIHSGALEMSNIDITMELTILMRAQQAFSGSSRLLQSVNEMARKLTNN